MLLLLRPVQLDELLALRLDAGPIYPPPRRTRTLRAKRRRVTSQNRSTPNNATLVKAGSHDALAGTYYEFGTTELRVGSDVVSIRALRTEKRVCIDVSIYPYPQHRGDPTFYFRSCSRAGSGSQTKSGVFKVGIERSGGIQVGPFSISRRWWLWVL